MIPMLSDLPPGAQAKIRQALGLLGEALIEIAGTARDEAAQADLFSPPITAVADIAATRVTPVRYDAIPESQRTAVRELAGTMTCRQIAEQLGIGENRVRWIAQQGGFTLKLAKTAPPSPQQVSQAVSPPAPVEAAPLRTHGAVEAAESMDKTMPGRAVPGPDETLLPSSGSEPSHGPFVLTEQRLAELAQAGPVSIGMDYARGPDWSADPANIATESEAHPSTPPDAAAAPDATATDGAATPTAAPSLKTSENLPDALHSVTREPEAASPHAASEGEVAAEAATSQTDQRNQMIAEAKQAVALRKPEAVRPRMREPMRIAMQPVNNDWVRLRHPDGRWLSMDGLSWLDAKPSTRDNAYICQRKHLIAARAKFPLARECDEIAERPWSPRDIEWQRSTT